MNKILCGNCIDLLKEIDDDSIDFLLTDPPYGTNDNNGKSIKRGQVVTSFNTIDWDTELPLEWIDELYRIMKDDTWGVIFTDKKEITTMWNYLLSNNLTPRNTFYWIKTNKAPTPRKNFKSCVETAVVFTKGRTNQKWYSGGNENNYFMSPFVSGKENVGHPTQKSIKLFSYLIRLFTKETDIILDPFIGSGTTAVAALLLNRYYLGFDINLEYIKMAEKRINTISKSKNNMWF